MIFPDPADAAGDVAELLRLIKRCRRRGIDPQEEPRFWELKQGLEAIGQWLELIDKLGLHPASVRQEATSI